MHVASRHLLRARLSKQIVSCARKASWFGVAVYDEARCLGMAWMLSLVSKQANTGCREPREIEKRVNKILSNGDRQQKRKGGGVGACRRRGGVGNGLLLPSLGGYSSGTVSFSVCRVSRDPGLPPSTGQARKYPDLDWGTQQAGSKQGPRDQPGPLRPRYGERSRVP